MSRCQPNNFDVGDMQYPHGVEIKTGVRSDGLEESIQLESYRTILCAYRLSFDSGFKNA